MGKFRARIKPHDDAAFLPSRIHDTIGIDKAFEREALVDHREKPSLFGKLDDRQQVFDSF